MTCTRGRGGGVCRQRRRGRQRRNETKRKANSGNNSKFLNDTSGGGGRKVRHRRQHEKGNQIARTRILFWLLVCGWCCLDVKSHNQFFRAMASTKSELDLGTQFLQSPRCLLHISHRSTLAPRVHSSNRLHFNARAHESLATGELPLPCCSADLHP